MMQSAAKLQRISPTARVKEWAADFELLTAKVRAELADDHFTAALCHYREAVNVARACALEETAVRLGVELATQILPLGSRLAQALLLEAAEADVAKMIPAEIWDSIHKRGPEEAVSSAPPLPQAAKPNIAPAITIAIEPAAATVRRMRASRWDWNFLATAATLAFTVAAIGTASALIWMNHSRGVHKPPSADDKAWGAVNTRDADLVESYLIRFPAGAHRGQAVLALSAIRVQHRESAEVAGVLKDYETAWNARNRPMVMQLSAATASRMEGNRAIVRCLRKVSGPSEDGSQQSVVFILGKRNGAWMIESAR